MRTIQFIAPVESMRGNLSGKQDLAYNPDNSKAFEAAEGKQFANNYLTRYVGARRAATGKNFFAVKQRSAVNINTNTLLNMATTGAIGAMYADILKSPTILARLQYSWKEYFHSKKTFRAWTYEYLAVMLRTKVPAVNMGHDQEGNIIYVGNPWNFDSTTPYIPAVSTEILVKFWLQLGSNRAGNAPIYFTIDGITGIAFEGRTFNSFLKDAPERFNVLNIVQSTISLENDYICMGEDGNFIVLGETYQTMQSIPVVDGKYITTTTQPA